jgi:DNA polymerase-3 subunit epsilon
VNRRFTGNNWHSYVKPERKIEEGAKAVHGISDEFLADKRTFGEIAAEFVEYVRGAELIIHNAAFDVEFLDAELDRAGLPRLSGHGVAVIDTLRLARDLHPGKRNSLDALCDRYEIDNAHRSLHGALLDAELLAEVYLSMTRGQNSLAIEPESRTLPGEQAGHASGLGTLDRPVLMVLRASADELAAHAQLLAGINKDSGGHCVWLESAAGENSA